MNICYYANGIWYNACVCQKTIHNATDYIIAGGAIPFKHKIFLLNGG